MKNQNLNFYFEKRSKWILMMMTQTTKSEFVVRDFASFLFLFFCWCFVFVNDGVTIFRISFLSFLFSCKMLINSIFIRQKEKKENRKKEEENTNREQNRENHIRNHIMKMNVFLLCYFDAHFIIDYVSLSIIYWFVFRYI